MAIARACVRYLIPLRLIKMHVRSRSLSLSLPFSLSSSMVVALPSRETPGKFPRADVCLSPAVLEPDDAFSADATRCTERERRTPARRGERARGETRIICFYASLAAGDTSRYKVESWRSRRGCSYVGTLVRRSRAAQSHAHKSADRVCVPSGRAIPLIIYWVK